MRSLLASIVSILFIRTINFFAHFTVPFNNWLGQFLASYFCRWCSSCCVYWQKLKPFYRRLIVNLLIGITITLLLIPMQDIRFFHETEDIGIDWVMKMFRNTAPNQDSPPFVLLDIDEQTYQNWGEPLITPRDKLLTLLKFAVAGDAKIIIVDIDLSYPIDRLSEQLHSADQALYDFFAHYEVNCANTTCPHILLTRTFRKSLTNSKYDNVVRHSFLDSAVAKSPHIHWASTTYDLSRDRVLRRWHLWQVACSDGFPVVVPSMQLLAVALLNNPTQGACQLGNELAAVTPVDCAGEHSWITPASYGSTHLLVGGDVQLSLSPSRLSRRILYTIPWQISEEETRPLTQQARPLLATLPAYKITDPNLGNNALLRESITIIGGSFQDSRDIYATPFGWMPGQLVITNAIHSLLQFGELTPPPLWVIILIQIALILIMSIAFALLGSLLGMLFSIVAIVIVMIPASFWLIKYGVWLNFALAFIIVHLNQMLADYWEVKNLLLKKWKMPHSPKIKAN